MTTYREDTTVYPALVDLAACLELEFVAAELPRPCEVQVLPGQIVSFDYCGEGGCDLDGCGNGQAWVRLVNVQAVVRQSETGTSTGVAFTSCRGEYIFQLEMGVTRCIPGVDASGNPPTTEELLEATRFQLADMDTMRRAITCCFATDRQWGENRGVQMESYTPVGPEGGCVGGYWTFYIGSS
jgi:hypothetical protein